MAETEMKHIKTFHTILFILIAAAGIHCSLFQSSPHTDYKYMVSELAPGLQSFQINPDRVSTITGGIGTRLIIPPKAFVDKKGGIATGPITVTLREAYSSLAIAFSGVDMCYTDQSGQRYLFESAGMFKVDADQNGTPLRLAPGKKINVQMPNVAPGSKFNIYRLDKNGTWQYYGHNQESGPPARTESSDPRRVIDVRTFFITGLTWWNIDYPDSNIACLKGTVRYKDGRKGKILSAFAVGVSNRFGFKGIGSDNEFRVYSLIASKAKVVVIDTEGFAGISDTVRTWSNPGNINRPESRFNQCQDIGVIEMKKIPIGKMGVARFLGFKEERFNVIYHYKDNTSPFDVKDESVPKSSSVPTL